MSTALEITAFAYLGVISVVLAIIDVRHHRLPNRIVLPSYGVGGALLLGAVLFGAPAAALGRALIGMMILFGFYLLLRVLSRRGLGGGDVKLAGVLGLYLGWLGWEALAIGALAGFVVGGAAGVLLILVGRAGRRTRIAFGPAMLIGAWMVIGASIAGSGIGPMVA
ncbi:leader peptidase (prepilin peptidase)/N-methyltransferase [Microbacterium sp. AK009]|uniref:prepilin peptidase n=1 Tax=Microbacterium sp. AK009 TaxID=2723068 RepID=UPI0018079B91|nr:A24 family peptidase [Microbacterium sp. AK009]NYF16354.1 leader peptidase (prepilin peptidase)/N-methyltransferase [Microbacterium sp. AK009]